ncbi:hypothetical protein ASG49_03695 [Marmoricola sp. Leaf446]|nr:hypothetical protein ASG49_03695 [Marmoricola sp. Leaf446]
MVVTAVLVVVLVVVTVVYRDVTSSQEPPRTFSDDFAAAQLASQWTRESSDGYGIETFTSDEDLVTVDDDDRLVVSAKRNEDGSWRGGMVSTRKSFKLSSGTVEVRAALPTAQGAWPAIWLHNSAYGEAGPARAEIDIMELFPGGGDGGPGSYMTVHDWVHNDQGTFMKPPHVPSTDGRMHTWKISWDATGISLWIDGEPQGKITATEFNALGNGADWSVFTKTDQYLILNMAVGTSWGGPEPTPDTNRLDMLVDWVKIRRGD